MRFKLSDSLGKSFPKIFKLKLRQFWKEKSIAVRKLMMRVIGVSGFPMAGSLCRRYIGFWSLQASENERIDSLPPISEHPIGVSCIGMSASELLLRRHLGFQWEALHIDDDYLWVLGEKDGDLNEA